MMMTSHKTKRTHRIPEDDHDTAMLRILASVATSHYNHYPNFPDEGEECVKYEVGVVGTSVHAVDCIPNEIKIPIVETTYSKKRPALMSLFKERKLSHRKKKRRKLDLPLLDHPRTGRVPVEADACVKLEARRICPSSRTHTLSSSIIGSSLRCGCANPLLPPVHLACSHLLPAPTFKSSCRENKIQPLSVELMTYAEFIRGKTWG
jgi:hypothetical protein